MKQWKRAITTGNRHFAQNDFETALYHYRQALAEAQRLFDKWPDVDNAVAALVIAHHNLADLFLQQGRTDEAGCHLCRAHERLTGAIADVRLAPGLRQAALRHSSHTYARLLQFASQHGYEAQVAETLGGHHPQPAIWIH